MTGPSLVRFEGASCRFGDDAVLDSIDLEIGGGEFVGVVGPSGSGKTTLLRTILGDVRPYRGRFDRAPGVRVGYVPQVETVDWNFPITVGQCVLMARPRSRLVPWASPAERDEVAAVLAALGIGELAGRHIRDLSGGQQQRVFLARALLGRPDLLLLDEPTSGVDVRTRHDVLHLLRDLNDDGIAIVLTTHDLNGIAAHLPRIVCLNRVVVADGAPREVLSPDVLERTYGARLDVLEHGGMPVVVDGWREPGARVVPLRREA